MNFSENGVFVMIDLFVLPLDYIYNLWYNGINRVAKLLDKSEFNEIMKTF